MTTGRKRENKSSQTPAADALKNLLEERDSLTESVQVLTEENKRLKHGLQQLEPFEPLLHLEAIANELTKLNLSESHYTDIGSFHIDVNAGHGGIRFRPSETVLRLATLPAENSREIHLLNEHTFLSLLESIGKMKALESERHRLEEQLRPLRPLDYVKRYLTFRNNEELDGPRT